MKPTWLSCYFKVRLSSYVDIPSSEERKRNAYRQKITECIDRAEKLKDLVEQQKGIVMLLFFDCSVCVCKKKVGVRKYTEVER